MRGLVLDTHRGTLEESDFDDYSGALLLTDDYEPVVEVAVWSTLGMWLHVVDAQTPRAGLRLEVTPAQLESLYCVSEPARTNLWARLAAKYAAP